MLLNRTKKKVLARKTVFFCNAWRQGLGLMFSSAKAHHAYIFPVKEPRRVSLHMWFVFSSIDVLYLRKKKVVELVHQFKPFTTYVPTQVADTIIELPAGTLKRTKTARKDVVIIE